MGTTPLHAGHITAKTVFGATGEDLEFLLVAVRAFGRQDKGQLLLVMLISTLNCSVGSRLRGWRRCKKTTKSHTSLTCLKLTCSTFEHNHVV